MPYLLTELIIYLLISVLLGMVPRALRTRTAAVVGEIVAHAFGWAGVLYAITLWVSKFQPIFKDFQTQLPFISRMVLQLSERLNPGPLFYRVAVGVAGLLAVDAVVFCLLWNSNTKPNYRLLWTAVMTAIPMLIVIGIMVAMLIPLRTLMHQLS